MQEIEDVLSRLSPKTRQRVQLANQILLERHPTPSIGLNAALGGGLGFGRQSLIWGAKSAGKSSFILQTIARAQEEGTVCGLVDAEGTFDSDWAQKLGVDTSRLIVSPVKSIEDMTTEVLDFMESGVRLVAVDSISALLGSAYFEKDGTELKSLGQTKQIGNEARDLANSVKMINYANKDTSLLLVSQVRNKIGTYGASLNFTGGHAVDFFSSTVIKLWATPRIDDQITQEVIVGSRAYKRPVGREVTWTIDKNKIGPPSSQGSYNFYYRGDHVGIDSISEILTLAIENGITERSKSGWHTIYDKKVQGDINAANYLRENPAILEKIKAELHESL